MRKQKAIYCTLVILKLVKVTILGKYALIKAKMLSLRRLLASRTCSILNRRRILTLLVVMVTHLVRIETLNFHKAHQLLNMTVLTK